MIKELHQKLVNKEITVQDLVCNYFNTIHKKDPEVRAFLTLTETTALQAAKKIDDDVKDGKTLGLLAGIPFAVKDNILTKKVKTTAGSKILKNYIGTYDAFVIQKLKEAGAILVGKTNMDEFAMGSSTENSAFFPTKNPADLTRVPGGSSGGSAAAVASEMVPFALGSDTGGSIRQPASFCGVVGFKPTYGAVSRSGLIAMASSLDVIGPLTTSVEDAQIVFQAIQGKDKMDATSYDLNPNAQSNLEKAKIKIGVIDEYLSEGLDQDVKNIFQGTIEKLKKEDIQVKNIKVNYSKYALPAYYIIMPAEVSTNLARYDSIRYGKINELESSIQTLNDLYFKTRGYGFGKEVRRRLILGTYVLSKGYYDAYYKKAQKVRRLIYQEWQQIFKDVDFVIMPTTPTPAFELGSKTQDPLAMYLSDIFTVVANISGGPAINIKAGKNAQGLPLGIQILGKHYSDYSLLSFAKKVEKLINYEE